MEQTRVLAVIPARYSSTRFPGKPLVTIAGEPMVTHVVRRAVEASCFDEVIVATDDERIADAGSAAGARVVLTGACRSGTDRVAAAIRGIQASAVVNVQGDEPAQPPANLRLLATFLRENPQAPAATLALPGSARDLTDPNVVKVVCDVTGRALYFSRAAIPYPRNPEAGTVRRHVGLYGFQKHALLAFTSWPEAELERAEGLEQLRALVNGMPMQVLLGVGGSVSVDVPGDVPRAEAALLALAGRGSGVRDPGSGR